MTVIAAQQLPLGKGWTKMSARQYRKAAVLALVTTVGLGMAACSSSSSTSSSGVTTITVDCAPQKTDNNGKSLAQWNADIAAFEKIHTDVKIESISVGTQCDNPPDFTARLQGGTEADVFYGYMTDLAQVLNADQATDITKYINSTTVPAWGDITAVAKSAFTDSGKVYAIPFSAYTMGIVYNKTLFTQAGLDPTKPPATWQEVATDAKAIADKTHEVGYEDYSAGNTGGWHFTAELYSRGGNDLTPDGKTGNVNTPEGVAVLQNLHNMRFVDNSMGIKQLKTWPDLLTDAAAGKVGIYVGAPDSISAIVNNFKGKYSDWAMGPLPGDGGAAKGTLGGGNGYMFKKGDTPAQIKAGLEFLSFEELTPGQGQYNYKAQNAEGLPVGLPTSQLFTVGSPIEKQIDALAAANTNLTLSDYKPFVDNPVPAIIEPPNAQALYAELDKVMSAVLTDPNANIPALLATAQSSITKIAAQSGS
jgi:multiple sugar transport system substrate-binding protein